MVIIYYHQTGKVVKGPILRSSKQYVSLLGYIPIIFQILLYLIIWFNVLHRKQVHWTRTINNSDIYRWDSRSHFYTIY